MECIVRFEVKYKQETKRLRGLLFVEKGKTPDTGQLIDMFKDMNYHVALADPDKLLFTAHGGRPDVRPHSGPRAGHRGSQIHRRPGFEKGRH
ncbi:hypothetical protein VQ056_29275 [Paenibacillus sp. JTLBN-2024]